MVRSFSIRFNCANSSQIVIRDVNFGSSSVGVISEIIIVPVPHFGTESCPYEISRKKTRFVLASLCY